MAFRLELSSKLQVVVDLAVENQPKTAVGAGHRLVAERAEIQNTQAAKTQPPAAAGLETAVVGTAMLQRLLKAGRKLTGRFGLFVDPSENAAHNNRLVQFQIADSPTGRPIADCF